MKKKNKKKSLFSFFFRISNQASIQNKIHMGRCPQDSSTGSNLNSRPWWRYWSYRASQKIFLFFYSYFLKIFNIKMLVGIFCFTQFLSIAQSSYYLLLSIFYRQHLPFSCNNGLKRRQRIRYRVPGIVTEFERSGSRVKFHVICVNQELWNTTVTLIIVIARILQSA